MHNLRKRHDAAFKAKVAFEAAKGEKTIAQLSSEFGVHANQIRQWRKQFLEELPRLFSDRRSKKEKDDEELRSELYRQIGQLKVELDWLKKNHRCSVEAKRIMIEPEHPMIPVCRQCELLDVARSSYYYRSNRDDSYNVMLMNLIDEQYIRTPFYGVPKMTAWLRRQGHQINPKRIRRLMRLMGIEAIYPKPRLSISSKEHLKYPYLLRGLTIDHPNQVWCTDITYIRMLHGFVYLVAIMDWFSRYILSWRLSTTLETAFCTDALQEALEHACPEIFSSDQGVQFTSQEFTDILLNAGIKISMDGRGRVYDNIFVERLWRTVKYEEVYLHDYRTVSEARSLLSSYFHFYNTERIHEALNYRTPYEVYYDKEHLPLTDQASYSMHLKQPCFLS
jgi:putative transposase